jgi:hypothetical protein
VYYMYIIRYIGREFMYHIMIYKQHPNMNTILYNPHEDTHIHSAEWFSAQIICCSICNCYFKKRYAPTNKKEQELEWTTWGYTSTT